MLILLLQNLLFQKLAEILLNSPRVIYAAKRSDLDKNNWKKVNCMPWWANFLRIVCSCCDVYSKN